MWLQVDSLDGVDRGSVRAGFQMKRLSYPPVEGICRWAAIDQLMKLKLNFENEGIWLWLQVFSLDGIDRDWVGA